MSFCKEFFAHASVVNFIVFSPDNIHFASSSSDCTVKIWNIITGKLQNSITLSRGDIPICLQYCKQGNYLAIGTFMGNVFVRSVKCDSLKPIQKVSKRDEQVLAVAFSHDGKYLASRGKKQNEISVFNLETNKVIVLRGYNDVWLSIQCLLFLQNGCLMTFSINRGVTTWKCEAETFTKISEVKIPTTSNVGESSFSKDGSLLVFAGLTKYNVVEVWDLNTLTKKEFPHKYVISAAQLIDNKYLLTACSNYYLSPNPYDFQITICMWNLDKSICVRTMSATDHVYAFGVSNCKKYYAIQNGPIKLFKFLDESFLSKFALPLIKHQTSHLIILEILNFLQASQYKSSFDQEYNYFHFEKTMFIETLKRLFINC